MNSAQRIFFVFATVVAVGQLTIISVHLAGIRGELARLRKMVP